MRDTVVLLDAFIFTLAFVCSGTEAQDAAMRSPLVHLLRYKRFDFSMFGCSCRPVMECHSDQECVMRKGRGYSCEFKCCSFSCVIRNSGHRSVYLGDKENNNNKPFEDEQRNPTNILEENSQVNLSIQDTSTPVHTSTERTDNTSDVFKNVSDPNL